MGRVAVLIFGVNERDGDGSSRKTRRVGGVGMIVVCFSL